MCPVLKIINWNNNDRIDAKRESQCDFETSRLRNFQTSKLRDFQTSFLRSRALSQCSCATFETSFKPFQIYEFQIWNSLKEVSKFAQLHYDSARQRRKEVWKSRSLEVWKLRSREVSKLHCDSRSNAYKHVWDCKKLSPLVLRSIGFPTE